MLGQVTPMKIGAGPCRGLRLEDLLKASQESLIEADGVGKIVIPAGARKTELGNPAWRQAPRAAPHGCQANCKPRSCLKRTSHVSRPMPWIGKGPTELTPGILKAFKVSIARFN